jgi:hypothetical protein
MYEITMSVKGFNHLSVKRIGKFLRESYKIDIAFCQSGNIENAELKSTFKVDLSGQDERDYSKKIAMDVMRENGEPCDVVVWATCLEDLPHNTYYFEAEQASLLFPGMFTKGE